MRRRKEGQPAALLESKVARRMFLLFIACAILPMAVLGFFSAKTVADQVHEQANERVQETVRTIGMALVERLNALEEDLDLVRSQIGPRGSFDSARRVVDKVVGERYLGLTLFDAEGSILDRAGDATPLPVLDPEALGHVAEGLTLVQGFVDATGIARILFVTRDERGSLLVASANPGYLWQEFGVRARFSDLIISDGGGGLLFTTLRDHVGSETLEEIQRFGTGRDVFTWEFGDEKYVGALWTLFTKPQFRFNFVLVYGERESILLAPVFQIMRLLSLITCFTSLCVLLLSRRQIARFLSPLKELKEATERVAAEDFGSPVVIESKDEFKTLGEAFNRMSTRLSRNLQEREDFARRLVRARDAALTAARVKAEFLQNVSHELRTPLTSIQASAEILKLYDDGDPEERAEFVDTIATETQRLTSLVENVLRLSEIESESAMWSFEEQDVRASLDGAIDTLAPTARECGVSVSRSFEHDLMPIQIDSHKIGQVWVSLLENAVKFSPAGGLVVIAARSEEDAVVVEVQDRGAGISGEDLMDIFEHFHQSSDDLTTDKPQGTGVGLSIARAIVRRHSGSIEVQSEVGKGSLFRVRLPITLETMDQKLAAIRRGAEPV